MASYTVQTLFTGADNADLNDLLLDGGNIQTASLSVSNPEADVTAATGSAVVSAATLQGLGTWQVTTTGFLLPTLTVAQNASSPIHSALGTVVEQFWNMTITAQPQDATGKGSTATVWRSFLPGLVRWSGSFGFFADSATAMDLPSAITGSASFFIADDTTDHALSGSINATQVSAPFQIGNLLLFTYNFVGNGDLTMAGAGSRVPIFPEGVVSPPAADAVNFIGATSRTYVGDATWSSVTLNSTVGQPFTIGTTLQGTGALTIG